MTTESTTESISTSTSQQWLILTPVRFTSRKRAPLRSAPQKTAPARSPSNSSAMSDHRAQVSSVPPVKFGIIFGNMGPFGLTGAGAKALVTAAEDVGIESVWTVEHVLVPEGYESPYPYSADGKMQGPDDMPIPDSFTWLAYVAALTSTLKLATGVAILPQRNVVYTAKEIATLDQLSGGRVILGVGAGWMKEEFEAVGVPFERRGARTDEYIGALRALW